MKRDREAVKRGLKLLPVKMLLGAVAAIGGMLLFRVVGSREILVACFIGLVPGVSERSLKKFFYGVVFALAGYLIGGQISALLAKRLVPEVPFGHWAITGAFIGMTAGISTRKGQWFSFRFVLLSLGALWGFWLGFIFGILGDIGGFLTVSFEKFNLFYYMREVQLVFAGVFISLGAGIASILTLPLDNGLWRVARVVEGAESAATAPRRSMSGAE